MPETMMAHHRAHRTTASQVHASALNGWDGLVDPAHVPEIHALRDTLPCDISRPSIPLKDFVRFSEAVVARSRDVSIPWAAGMRFDLGTLGGALGEPVLAPRGSVRRCAGWSICSWSCRIARK